VRVVHVPTWVWTSVRKIVWHPLMQITGTAIAPQLFWRFTLIVDHGFWLDTSKLQALRETAPMALDDGLLQMIASAASELTRLM
jgi:hypothetical protein